MLCAGRRARTLFRHSLGHFTLTCVAHCARSLVQGPPKRKKEKENQAVQIASDIIEAEREEADTEYVVGNWSFTSHNAIIEEYMENMYQCVSSI